MESNIGSPQFVRNWLGRLRRVSIRAAINQTGVRHRLTEFNPPARASVEWLIGFRIPGGLGNFVRDRVTLGYASCFGSPAAYLALARRGLLAIARLRRAFPTNSPVGRLIAGLLVFKKNRANAKMHIARRPPAADIPGVVDR